MKWRIRDIIDLEYFLHSDAEGQAQGDQQDLHERDRNIYLARPPGDDQGLAGPEAG